MLLYNIIEGIQMVKGENISVINLRKKVNFICDYFVICNGNSKNQIFAIYQSIEKFTIEKMNKKPYHIEGLRSKEWILIDYISIVVHIFQKEKRYFYNIESLWKDI
ncbi:ribosome silencing factor [Blattabacterium cuenoti]|uniref:ribosome silencing factor n=1 Tax=Blattabacterium cuenoti TaxID=1653831 RepID=UPI00163BA288|nr:ribosome silencing factor [Blattabacterium cuenoti]